MPTPNVVYAIAFGCIAAIYVSKQYLWKQGSVLPLPPGPPGIPWFGNIFGIHPNAPWLTHREWAKMYGDIVHARLLGKDIIIINSEKLAKGLLEKQVANNLDRPYFITIEMSGFDFNTFFMPYGERWRLHRRFFHQSFRKDAVQRFFPLQHRKACHLLRQLLRSPDQFSRHVFEYLTVIILNATYGYDPLSSNDDLYKMVVKVHETMTSVLRPETSMIFEVFPALMRLPEWFPGMSLKKEMLAARKLAEQYMETAFERSLQTMKDRVAESSMVRDALQGVEEKGAVPDKVWMKTIKEAAAASFLAGVEAPRATLMTFFLMMMLNPEAQGKAQVQIDSVVGKTRLPTMDDRPLLPFVDAILRELYRYSPVAPLSAPRITVNEDAYGGFRIPMGALLVGNMWLMGHDESRYPNPNAFIPERFLNEDGSLKPDDIDHIPFGFGRRKCVGRHFADAIIWSLMAKILAAFKILKPLDEEGVEINVEPKFVNEFAVGPAPFECRIVPRTPGMDLAQLEELIAASSA